jgi:hypothetical protein
MLSFRAVKAHRRCLMPHVMDDTETLEHAAAPAGDTTHARTLVLSPRRGRFSLLAAVGRLFTALWRRRPQELHDVRGTQQFELPLDILARKHPDLYLRLMTGAG